MSDAERFWNKVERLSENECWLWRAAQTHNGYGCMDCNVHERRAHRVSWFLHYGEIPKGMMVLHSCDKRLCVNPAHLFLGTAKDNTEDMISKGRASMDYWKNHPEEITWRGINNPQHILSEFDVIEIKSLYRPYVVGLVAGLAKKFGVSGSTVLQIGTGKKWRHLNAYCK